MLRFDDPPNLNVHKVTDMDIWIKPTNPDGLVFYWGHVDSRQMYAGGDFVALLLRAWIPYFYWNLGSGVAFIKSVIQSTTYHIFIADPINYYHHIDIHQ